MNEQPMECLVVDGDLIHGSLEILVQRTVAGTPRYVRCESNQSHRLDTLQLPTIKALRARGLDGINHNGSASVYRLVPGQWAQIVTEAEAYTARQKTERDREATEERRSFRRVITGAEADIEATYPGGYAAFVRAGRRAEHADPAGPRES